jgi:hypothetical protein
VVALVAALLVAVGVGLGWERSPAVSSPTGGQGGPVVAGAATSVAPTPPPTSGPPATTGSSTTATSGTTSTTVPVAPPVLAVTPARVDLGAAATGATLTVRNGGGEPLSWTAAPSASWLRVSPASGDLDGGRQARLSLAATRDGLPEGAAGARVRLTWGGGPARSVVVALRVEHAPAVTDLAASPPEIFAGPCTPATTLVEATVTDESPLSSVTLRWGRQQVPMTQRNGRWFARLARRRLPASSPGRSSPATTGATPPRPRAPRCASSPARRNVSPETCKGRRPRGLLPATARRTRRSP